MQSHSGEWPKGGSHDESSRNESGRNESSHNESSHNESVPAPDGKLALLLFLLFYFWADSAIAPPPSPLHHPKPAIFFNERFVAARHEERCFAKSIFVYFLFGKGLSNDDVGVARGAIFQEKSYGGKLVSKPAISLKKCCGATENDY